MIETAQSAPVLLGGENRSGTTLLSVVLDSHPDLTVAPEIDFLEPVNLGPHVLEACRLLKARDERVLGPGTSTADPFWYDGAHFVKQCDRSGISISDLETILRRLMARFDSNLSSFDERCHVVDALGSRLQAANGAMRWGLKLQRKITRIDRFAAFWPNAHFVHIIRDGRDLAASHLRTVPDWGYGTVARAAEEWKNIVEPPAALAPEGRYLEVRYEDLVAAPANVLRRITTFLGLAWSDQVLRHDTVSHALLETPWGHPAADAVSKPITTNAIGRYVNDLAPVDIAEFEAIAGAALRRFGYDLCNDRIPGTAAKAR